MTRPATVLLLFASLPLTAGPPALEPAYLLELPESLKTILIAETATSTLHYFAGDGGVASKLGESYMSIGQNGAGKERAWDRKTPLGIYFVSDRLDTSRLHEKYGPEAFPLDYPNIWDRRQRRDGGGIWIHGVAQGAGRRPPLDTDGCIALPNDVLLTLGERLVPRQTPVLIARTLRWADAADVAAARNELRAALDAWGASYASGDLYRYLSMYADDFRYRGMDRDDWAAFRTQSISRAPPRRVELDDVLLLGDPEEEGLFLARFRQSIVYDDRTVTTVKRLYWRRSDDGALYIVAEDNG